MGVLPPCIPRGRLRPGRVTRDSRTRLFLFPTPGSSGRSAGEYGCCGREREGGAGNAPLGPPGAAQPWNSRSGVGIGLDCTGLHWEGGSGGKEGS